MLFIFVIAKLYVTSVTFPPIIKIIFYHFGIYDDIHVTLPLIINGTYDLGILYYCLLIYEIIIIYGVLAMIVLIISTYVILQFSVDWKQMSDNVEMIFSIIGSMFTVFIMFYVGQKLLDHSTTAFEELRQVPFHVLSVKTQKLFLFLITRSLKPSFLSIGGLFASSHEVFASVIN
ncbi:hypothetical protein M0802_009717 [Mischocyttarus mexicanus]|nr:hypothetical protein M0802_009717 [Mischocyttarus mexicanus]